MTTIPPPATRPRTPSDRPQPRWVRGVCPRCGEPLVSNLYLRAGGLLLLWECWASLLPEPACPYREVR